MDKPEVLVDGYKQGVTLAKRDRESSRSLVSRWALVKELVQLPSLNSDSVVSNNRNYEDLKEEAGGGAYHRAWTKLKDFYRYWINDERKREAQTFTLLFSDAKIAK